MSIRSTMEIIVWSPREYNTVADHAVNATMGATDEGEGNCSWVDDYALKAALEDNVNLRLCVDGGVRGSIIAAIGFCLYAARRNERGRYTYEVLVRQGHVLSETGSAFIAESIALESSLTFLTEILKNHMHNKGGRGD